MGSFRIQPSCHVDIEVHLVDFDWARVTVADRPDIPIGVNTLDCTVARGGWRGAHHQKLFFIFKSPFSTATTVLPRK